MKLDSILARCQLSVLRSSHWNPPDPIPFSGTLETARWLEVDGFRFVSFASYWGDWFRGRSGGHYGLLLCPTQLPQTSRPRRRQTMRSCWKVYPISNTQIKRNVSIQRHDSFTQYESSQLFARIVEMEESWELRFLSKKQFSRPSLILHSGGRRWNVHCTNFIEQVIQTILILRKHACLNFNRVASDIVSIGENWH